MMGPTKTILAPPAPGKIGVALDPVRIQRYLDDLREWVASRREELDQLDAAVLRSPQRATLTRDMMLAMALWKAVSDRFDLLFATWDGGRVGVTERERLSSLIWGRLDATLDQSLLARAGQSDADSFAATTSGLAVSLPEACRLSDAMTGQLRTRLSIDPNADEMARRLKDLRAQLERIRDQVALEPAALRTEPQAKLDDLASRVQEMVGKLSRGGDIGGMIAPAEIEAARFERDLIVGGVERRQAHDLIDNARTLRNDLEQREQALTSLVTQCVRHVSPAPKYAVPDVAALGQVPNTKDQIEAYLKKLDQVSRAMQIVQHAYSDALANREKLGARLQSAQAAASGLEDADLTALGGITQRTFDRLPTSMPLVTELVEAYELYVKSVQSMPDASPEEGR